MGNLMKTQPSTGAHFRQLRVNPFLCPLAFRVGLSTILCLSSFLAFAADEASPVRRHVLIDASISAWRLPHGNWVSVGDVGLNRSAPKLLTTGDGSGILVNGDTGRTSICFLWQNTGTSWPTWNSWCPRVPTRAFTFKAGMRSKSWIVGEWRS